jgi:hypothetical protein
VNLYRPIRLERAIDAAGMSKREFSKATSYCPQTIVNWTIEGGQTPKASALAEVCLVLAKNDRELAAKWVAYILGLGRKPGPS